MPLSRLQCNKLLSSCFSESFILIYSSLLKDSFVNIVFFVDGFFFFSFSTLNLFATYGNPLQYSCLENPMDREAWQATGHRVAKSQTRLSDFTFTFWCPKFFDKKVADNLIDDPLDVTSHLSLADFRTLSLSLSFGSLIIVSLSMSLFEFICHGDCLGSLCSCLSSHLSSFQPVFFLHILSASLSLSISSGTPMVPMLIHLMVSHMSLNSVHFSTIFPFSVCQPQ